MQSEDALNVNEMNVKPGGKQRHMHPTRIPDDNPDPRLRGQLQSMVFDENLPPEHPDYIYCGQPKGMRRILEERGLWDDLVQANGGKAIPGDCAECKMTQKEKEKRAQEAAETMGGQDEEGETEEDRTFLPPVTGKKCCMRQVLAAQADFLSEKPLLQIEIEHRGHKCYFLPKYHCELNPIEMFWGWIKYRESSQFSCYHFLTMIRIPLSC